MSVHYRIVRTRAGVVATVHRPDMDPAGLDPRYDLRNHSPAGFEFGYGGSGPAQLALALLAHACGDSVGERYYQALKRSLVAGKEFPAWTVPRAWIVRWLLVHDASQPDPFLCAAERAQFAAIIRKDEQEDLNRV